MRKETGTATILILTDVEDDSLERLVRVAQADRGIHRWVLKVGIHNVIELKEVINAEGELSLIFYYFHKKDLINTTKNIAKERGIVALNVFDPILKTIDYAIYEGIAKPTEKAKRADYMSKVDAIEFAAKHDDGKKIQELNRADLVLIGVSRTGKTPLALYLANYGLKVANVPLVYGIKPPEEIFKFPKERVVGLTITPTRLYKIRVHRRNNIGVESWRYASLEAINNEVEFAEELMKKIGCLIIDITQKAIEETADEIFKFLGRED